MRGSRGEVLGFECSKESAWGLWHEKRSMIG